MANIYYGDGGTNGGNGNWSTIGNWYISLSVVCCGVTIPGTLAGRVPAPGDSVVIVGGPGAVNLSFTGGTWAGPVSWQSASTPGPNPVSLAAGTFSGTVTVGPMQTMGGLNRLVGIVGGNYPGTVVLNTTTSTALTGVCIPAITGGTLTGTVTRSPPVFSGGAVKLNEITGGTYSPTASCALGPGNILNDSNLPADPGFAVGGGTFSPIITVIIGSSPMSTKAVLTPPPPVSEPVLAGSAFSRPWSGWFRNLYNILRPGLATTIVTAKLTPGGANGSMTFTNGVLTSQTPAS